MFDRWSGRCRQSTVYPNICFEMGQSKTYLCWLTVYIDVLFGGAGNVESFDVAVSVVVASNPSYLEIQYRGIRPRCDSDIRKSHRWMKIGKHRGSNGNRGSRAEFLSERGASGVGGKWTMKEWGWTKERKTDENGAIEPDAPAGVWTIPGWEWIRGAPSCQGMMGCLSHDTTAINPHREVS